MREHSDEGRGGTEEQTPEEECCVFGGDEPEDTEGAKPECTEEGDFAAAFEDIAHHDGCKSEGTDEESESAEELEGG